MKLGARVLKTGVAISLAIYSAQFLHLSAPSFAGISAIFAMQPTVYRSYQALSQQFQANIIGALLAIGFTLAFGNSPVIIGLTCVLMLGIALSINMENYVSIALVTIVAIMEYNGDSFLIYALSRFGTTFVGLIAASVVNLLFMPPKYERKLFHELEEQTKRIGSWIRLTLHHATDYPLLKEEITNHNEELTRLRYFYLLYKEEYKTTLKKNTYAKSRRMVLFRTMVAATEQIFRVLKLLHKFERHLDYLPKELSNSIKDSLTNLITYHEHIYLVITQKGKVHAHCDFICEIDKHQAILIEHFTNYKESHEEDQYLHLLQLISAITIYQEKIKHLHELVESYHHHHQDEKKINID